MEDQTEAESEALIASARKRGRRLALTGDAETKRLIKAVAKSTVRSEIEAIKWEQYDEVSVGDFLPKNCWNKFLQFS